MRSFIICVLNKLLQVWSSQRGWDQWDL